MKKIIAIATMAIFMLLTSFSASAQHGYRGFADAVLGYEKGTTDFWGDSYSGFLGGVSTVHGYQMGHWFVGGGLSLLASTAAEKNPFLPIYAQSRYDYSLMSPKSFFALVKCGYDPLANGVYAGFGAGMRIALNGGITALNIGLNFSVRQEAADDHYTDGDPITYYAPFLTFGIEF